jgi:hypothetical protein
MEEIDLCWRLKNMGFRIIYSPDSVVYHLGGGSLPYDNPRKLYLNFRNNLWLLYKNLPARELFPVLFIRMVLDAVAAFKLLAEGNLNGIKSVLKAHYHFYGRSGKCTPNENSFQRSENLDTIRRCSGKVLFSSITSASAGPSPNSETSRSPKAVSRNKYQKPVLFSV